MNSKFGGWSSVSTIEDSTFLFFELVGEGVCVSGPVRFRMLKYRAFLCPCMIKLIRTDGIKREDLLPGLTVLSIACAVHSLPTCKRYYLIGEVALDGEARIRPKVSFPVRGISRKTLNVNDDSENVINFHI